MCSFSVAGAAPALFPPLPRRPPVTTLHHILPRPGGIQPSPPAPLIEVLAEIFLNGVVTIARTALRDGKFQRGDHLKVLYGTWSHHGIYAGGNRIIHFSKDAGRIIRTTLERFRDSRCQIWVVPSPARFPGPEIVKRAKSKLGQADYNLFQNNCEHFCNWCRSGRASSRQVDRWISY